MKLVSLRIEQLRQFRQPFELNDLAPGLNLIHGPNESGKSTLVRAIRAAFFERHRSNSVDDLRPWGDTSAAPTVELVFECMGMRWQLSKSFLQRKRCDLLVDGQACNGEAAEEKLAQLLGFEFSGRGGSRPEHWGIPGLLWVEQGTGHAIEHSVEYANEHLQSALNSLLGEVASTGGDDIIEAVDSARAQLLTGTGRPRGDYATLASRRELLEKELAVLEERIESYRAQVDRLGKLRVEHELAESEKPWETQKANLSLAEESLVEIQSWQQEQQRDSQALSACQKTLEAYRGQQSLAEKQKERLAEREAAHTRAQEHLDHLTESGTGIQSRVDQAREAYGKADLAVKQARQQEQRAQLERQVSQCGEQISTLESAIGKANEYQDQLHTARETVRENAVDLIALNALTEVCNQLNEARIRSEAVATRIDYELLEGKSISLNGEELAGRGKRLLLEDSNLDLHGIGVLNITPGGEDVASLRRRLARLEEEQSAQLAQMRVESLRAAEERATRQADGKAAEEKAKGLLEAVAPQGLELLCGQLESARQDLARSQGELDTLSEVEVVGITLAEAETVLEIAEQALAEAENAYGQFKQDMALAEQHVATTRQEQQALKDELQHPDRLAQIEELGENIEKTVAEERRLNGVIQARQAEIDRARPDLLAQDIERYRASAEELASQHQRRAHELAGLRGTLESLGAEGMEEQRDELAAELEHTRRRFDELHCRAQALDLLLGLLQDKRQALTRRLQAPLQKHLDHYLSVIFPDAHLEVDGHLVPGHFSRGNQHGQLAELSFGAREQMGLISRLAYADLLKEAGRPTLVILDDTLVHSDRQRLDQMKRILFDAGQRHQVLLFTCHPENWQDLGVAPMDLAAMKTSTAA